MLVQLLCNKNFIYGPFEFNLPSFVRRLAGLGRLMAFRRKLQLESRAALSISGTFWLVVLISSKTATTCSLFQLESIWQKWYQSAEVFRVQFFRIVYLRLEYSNLFDRLPSEWSGVVLFHSNQLTPFKMSSLLNFSFSPFSTASLCDTSKFSQVCG